jgi:hypothetical protein
MYICLHCALSRTNVEEDPVPAQPAWFSNLHNILAALRAWPRPFVDRQTVQNLLGVGRRRAQQILAPCVTEHVGPNGLADRDRLICHLAQLGRSDDGAFEIQRRRRVAQTVARLRQERILQPQLLIEAPARIVNQEFASLPPGIHLEPGRITVEFEEPQEALEKLLALAMAIGRNFDEFERSIQWST